MLTAELRAVVDRRRCRKCHRFMEPWSPAFWSTVFYVCSLCRTEHMLRFGELRVIGP